MLVWEVGALGANTTGDDNVAIGNNALLTNTTADDNTAIGRDALKLNTTGRRKCCGRICCFSF